VGVIVVARSGPAVVLIGMVRLRLRTTSTITIHFVAIRVHMVLSHRCRPTINNFIHIPRREAGLAARRESMLGF
jgi:hypothetical protein